MQCYILTVEKEGYTFDNFNDAMRFCIFHPEFIEIRVTYKDKLKPVEFWHRKTPKITWSSHCESVIEEMLPEYKINRQKHCYWICRNMSDERLNDLTMRLHFTRDIKYKEYLDTHFTINIMKIIREDEIIKSLSRCVNHDTNTNTISKKSKK